MASGTCSAAARRLHGHRGTAGGTSVFLSRQDSGQSSAAGTEDNGAHPCTPLSAGSRRPGTQAETFYPPGHPFPHARRTRRTGTGLHGGPGGTSHAGRRRRSRRNMRAHLRSSVACTAQCRQTARSARMASAARRLIAQKAARRPAGLRGGSDRSRQKQARGTAVRC